MLDGRHGGEQPALGEAVRGDLKRRRDQAHPEQAGPMLGLAHQRKPEVGDDQPRVLDRGVGDEQPELALQDAAQDPDQRGQRAHQQATTAHQTAGWPRKPNHTRSIA